MREQYAALRGRITNKLAGAVVDGILKGLKTGLFLLKIMIPVYLVVVLIRYSVLMDWLAEFFEPLMRVFHMPGTAVVPFVTSFFTDEYGVVAAMSGFHYDMAVCTTIAMICLQMHSLPLEAAVAAKIGFPAVGFTVFRIVMALIVGIFVGWLGGILL